MNTHQYKHREQEQRSELLRLLQLDEATLNEMIFEGAYDYLQNVFGTNAYGQENLPKTTEFWTWWRMEWNRIDSLFLNAITHKYADQYPQWYCVLRDRDTDHLYAIHDVKRLRAWYNHYHEASMSNRYINSSVVRATASEMISAIMAGKTREVSHG